LPFFLSLNQPKNLKFNMKLKVRLKYVNFLMKLVYFIDNF